MTDKDATQKASKESVRPLEGRRVLVVEDDSDTRHRLKFILGLTLYLRNLFRLR